MQPLSQAWDLSGRTKSIPLRDKLLRVAPVKSRRRRRKARASLSLFDRALSPAQERAASPPGAATCAGGDAEAQPPGRRHDTGGLARSAVRQGGRVLPPDADCRC